MAYEDFKDLNRITAADKVLCDKAFNIAKNQKYDRYQRGLASTIYNLFNKKLQVEVLCLQINRQLKMILFLINNIRRITKTSY